MIFITVLSSCEKKEILKLKTVWGEATINNNRLFQYTTVGEGLSHKYWFLHNLVETFESNIRLL